jgi:hypothetical protein
MDTHHITRRAAFATIGGALASTAALAVPVAAAVAEPEHAWVRAKRLAKELAAVLEELEHDPIGGKQIAIIEPSAIWFTDYDDYYLRTYLSEDQSEALNEWRSVSAEAAKQWDAYNAYTRRCPEAEAEYAKWRVIYKRQQDAHHAMIMALWNA